MLHARLGVASDSSTGYPFEVEERGTIVLDESAVEEEEIWRDDDDPDRDGWFCVRTDPFPCPASGCTYVATFMTAAHLILVWEESDDPNLLRDTLLGLGTWGGIRGSLGTGRPMGRLLPTTPGSLPGGRCMGCGLSNGDCLGDDSGAGDSVRAVRGAAWACLEESGWARVGECDLMGDVTLVYDDERISRDKLIGAMERGGFREVEAPVLNRRESDARVAR